MDSAILFYRLSLAIAGLSLGLGVEVVFWCVMREAYDLAALGVFLGVVSTSLIVLLIGGELWPI